MPDQLPGSAVNVWPSRAVPAIVGGEVLLGATGAAWTTAVAADVAELDPAEFVATTRTRRVEPASADDNVYVFPVAPRMLTQPAPAESHRRHW